MADKKRSSRAGVPAYLKSKGTQVWRSVTTDYVLRDDEKVLLEQICREADLIQELQEELRRLPIMMTGSMGQDIVNPLLMEIRQHRALMAQLHARLDLPELDKPAAGATDIAPNQNRSAAMSKWGKAYG